MMRFLIAAVLVLSYGLCLAEDFAQRIVERNATTAQSNETWAEDKYEPVWYIKHGYIFILGGLIVMALLKKFNRTSRESGPVRKEK